MVTSLYIVQQAKAKMCRYCTSSLGATQPSVSQTGGGWWFNGDTLRASGLNRWEKYSPDQSL